MALLQRKRGVGENSEINLASIMPAEMKAANRESSKASGAKAAAGKQRQHQKASLAAAM